MGKMRLNFDVRDVSVYSSSYSTLESEICLPFNFYSSSVNTGYLSNFSTNFRTDVEINDIHSDTYGPDNEVPMQGPFTEKYVGGYQYRHQQNWLSSSGNNRAEGWKLFVGRNLLFVEQGSNTVNLVNSRLPPRGIYYRDGTAKRPINIKNISSGNFDRDYQVVQTSGRYYNNKAMVAAGGFTDTNVASAYLAGVTDRAKQSRGNDKNIFIERFSAPGDPLTAGDANGGFGLDCDSAEYSVYNSLNYRNSMVRNPLKTLLTRRMGQFGTDSELGYVNSLSYASSASYHKTHYNTLERFILTGTLMWQITTSSLYDNWFVQHQLPQDNAAYAWMRGCSYLSGGIGG